MKLDLSSWPETVLPYLNILKEVALHFNAVMYIFKIVQDSVPGALGVRLHASYGAPDSGTREVTLLTHMGCINKQKQIYAEQFGWMPPSLAKDKPSSLPILYLRACSKCSRWRKYSTAKLKLHIENCRICPCGRAYQVGDKHEATCDAFQKYATRSIHWQYKKQPADECRLFEKTEATLIPVEGRWIADFETWSNIGVANGRYQTYCGTLMPPSGKEDEDVLVFYGVSALDDFMHYTLDNVSGIMWFHNGSRFDNILIERWLIENEIPIISSIITKSAIISLTFKGKRGKIILKDSNRFVSGSLLALCESFKIPVDKTKTDFDHGKITSWEDVAKYKEECIPYARRDVTALKAVVEKFEQQILEDNQVFASKSYTQAGLAYYIFSTTLTDRRLLLRTPIKYDNIMRETYRGGRLICGTKYWCAPNIDAMFYEALNNNGCISESTYSDIKKWLVYIDVNSLYPFAQMNTKYPCGSFEEIIVNENLNNSLISEVEFHSGLSRESEFYDERIYDKWNMMILEVDISCPKDISVPFLMSRDPAGRKNPDHPYDRVDGGKARQDLLDKEKTWYTGTELWDAVRIGYKIRRVYRYIIWSRQVDLFSDYVNHFYTLKKDAEKAGNSVKRLLAKMLLNALTGKFGQKTRNSKLQFLTKDSLNSTTNKWSKIKAPVSEVYSLLTDEGIEKGFAIQSESKSEFSQFPIQLSAFILAHSKVKMLHLTEAFDGLRKNPPLYGDTDSVVVTNDAFDLLGAKWVGPELGQVKDEYGFKIIAIIILAPKTYMVVYVKLPSFEIMCTMRCKGIPHYSDEYNPLFEETLTAEEISTFRNDLIALWTRRDKIPVPNVVFKQQRFIQMSSADALERNKLIATWAHDRSALKQKAFLKDISKEELKIALKNLDDHVLSICNKIIDRSTFLKKLSWSALFGLQNGTLKVECIFPQMKRSAFDSDLLSIGITPDLDARNVSSKSWWDAGHRSYANEKEDLINGTIAYPRGHEKLTHE